MNQTKIRQYQNENCKTCLSTRSMSNICVFTNEPCKALQRDLKDQKTYLDRIKAKELLHKLGEKHL